MARLYETDFYGWIQTQAGVVKAGNFARLDLVGLKKTYSLNVRLPEAFEAAYKYAIMGASTETGIDESTLSNPSPRTFEQTTIPDFWPET